MRDIRIGVCFAALILIPIFTMIILLGGATAGDGVDCKDYRNIFQKYNPGWHLTCDRYVKED